VEKFGWNRFLPSGRKDYCPIPPSTLRQQQWHVQFLRAEATMNSYLLPGLFTGQRIDQDMLSLGKQRIVTDPLA
jgi:hypothetical protein